MEKDKRKRLSAGIGEKSTVPQRINAKELVYLLGLVEADMEGLRVPEKY